ncbi:VCBS repeat-containing protein [Streptacidiphilus sp. ASG 303]|nr:VCBS repeat-containing protein [Streptacidiphilus sp. ASG 303]
MRGRERAGGVVVLRGSARGLARPVVVTRDSPGVPGPVRADEGFGGTVGAGDLDGDGRTDLVVSAGRGGPVVLWGGPRGLSGGTALRMPAGGSAAALAVADTDGDGHRDVVLLGTSAVTTAPGPDTVSVLHGPVRRSGASGRVRTLALRADRRDGITGGALAAGDLVGDRRAEVVVAGFTREDSGDLSAPGAWVLAEDARSLHRVLRLSGGSTAAVGDVDGDGRADLALGDPDAGEGAGRLVVRYGGARGLRPGGTGVTQRTPGVPGPVPGADAAHFGHAVAVRDTDGDGRAEVAVGVPDDGGPGPARTGVVLLLRGGPHGLSVRGVREVVSGRPAPEGVQEVFGGTVLLADVTGDGRAELLTAATGADDGHGVLHVSCAARPGPCPAAAAVGRAGLRGLPAADAFGFGGALAG